MSRVHDLLRRIFGFSSFRGMQEQVVNHVLSGGDALVLMPTGGGKSLCYQLPAMARPGTGLVVSPLIALMLGWVFGVLGLYRVGFWPEEHTAPIAFGISIALSLVLFVVGVAVFRRLEPRILKEA